MGPSRINPRFVFLLKDHIFEKQSELGISVHVLQPDRADFSLYSLFWELNSEPCACSITELCYQPKGTFRQSPAWQQPVAEWILWNECFCHKNKESVCGRPFLRETFWIKSLNFCISEIWISCIVFVTPRKPILTLFLSFFYHSSYVFTWAFFELSK